MAVLRFYFLFLLLGMSIDMYGQEIKNATFPYQDDPKIIKIISELKENESMYLPRPLAFYKDKDLSQNTKWPEFGPSHRDYSNDMPYMEDRKTAFYCGGGHAHRRFNDAWEYHLGSNRWFKLLASDGGDQGKVKGGWLHLSNHMKSPEKPISDQAKKDIALLRVWFEKYAVIKDGYLQTKNTNAGFMTSHNWDGLTYDPNIKKLLHAAGHEKGNGAEQYLFLMRQVADSTRLKELEVLEKSLVQSKSDMWIFDFEKNKWIKNYHNGEPVRTLQGGAFFHYIPDLKKSLYYHAHTNQPCMMWYDGVQNTWSDVKPNGGASLSELIHKTKLAPAQEQQVAYSPKHKKLVAVIEKETFIFDISKNQWDRVETIRKLRAHDAETIFSYDSKNDVFILIKSGAKRGEGAMEAFSLNDLKWEVLSPANGAPFAQWDCGEGFYHPELNCHVVYHANKTWIYRFK